VPGAGQGWHGASAAGDVPLQLPGCPGVSVLRGAPGMAGCQRAAVAGLSPKQGGKLGCHSCKPRGCSSSAEARGSDGHW